MNVPRILPYRLLPAAAALAAVALLAPAALARAPSAAEQASLDWVLLRVAKDREAEKAAPGAVDPITAYEKGMAALSEWTEIVKVVNDRMPGKAVERERIVNAINFRFATEDREKRLDPKEVWAQRRKICLATLDLMLRDDTNSKLLAWKLQRGLLPSEWWRWDQTYSKSKIKQAYEALKKWLSSN